MKRKARFLLTSVMILTIGALKFTNVYAQDNTADLTGVKAAAYAGDVYLTFDDGPNNATSQTLINNLKNAGCYRATLFVWGNRIAGNQSAWNAYKNSGFSLQNHSWTHSYMSNWSYQQVYNDFQQCNTAIQNAGKPRPTKVRLPYLYSNNTITQACSAFL